MRLIRTLTEDPQFACKLLIENGGRGIRTSGTVPRTAVFKPKNNTHINPRKPTKTNNDAGFSTFALGWFRFFSAEVRAQNQHSLYIRMDSLSVGWTASCCRKDLCRFSRSNPMGFNPMCRFCARGRPPVRHFKHPAHWDKPRPRMTIGLSGQDPAHSRSRPASRLSSLRSVSSPWLPRMANT